MTRLKFGLAAVLTILWLSPAAAQTAADVAANLREGRLQEAIEMADSLLERRPQDVQLWTLRGVALEQVPQPTESLDSFKRALDLSPNYLPALQGAAQIAYSQHSPDAERYLERIVESDPSNPTAHAMLGALAAESHKCSEAIKEFAGATAVIQANANALMEFGNCQLLEGRSADAIDTFNQLTTLRPDDLSARYKLAWSLGGAGRVNEALQILKVLPADAQVSSLKAEYYEKQNHPELAAAALRDAIQIAPDEEQNYVDLGRVCIERRMPQDAVKVMNEGLLRLPPSARLYTIRGAAYAWLNDPEDAAKDFEMADHLEPDHLYGSIGLSMLLRQDQHLPEAVAVLRSKLSERPDDSTLNYLLADTLIRTGTEPGQEPFEEAISLLNRSLSLDPGFQKARISLGKLYLRDSRTADAEREFREAVRIEPPDRSALTQLILLLKRDGKSKEAALWAVKLKALVAAGEAAIQ